MEANAGNLFKCKSHKALFNDILPWFEYAIQRRCHYKNISHCFFRVLELEESLGSSHLLQQNIKQKDEKVSSLNQVIQEREEKLAELENRYVKAINFYYSLNRMLSQRPQLSIARYVS